MFPLCKKITSCTAEVENDDMALKQEAVSAFKGRRTDWLSEGRSWDGRLEGKKFICFAWSCFGSSFSLGGRMEELKVDVSRKESGFLQQITQQDMHLLFGWVPLPKS
jgi:hypothetical protein